MSINKFSFALKKGFNELNQTSQVLGDPNGKMRAFVAYFNLETTSNGDAQIGAFGGRVIGEDDIVEHRAAYLRNNGDKGYLHMLDQVEQTFSDIRSKGLSIEQTNFELKQKTEDFYQTYIAGETIKQTFSPLAEGLDHLANKEIDPQDEFMHRRGLQKTHDRIGETVVIPHSRIRLAWDLD